MTTRPAVLLIGFGDAHDALAGRLLLLGVRPLRAETPAGAAKLLGRQDERVRVGLLPADPPFPMLGDALLPVKQAAGALGMEWIVVGERPAPAALATFVRAGVQHALFTPFTDGELRFVLNRALFDRTRGDVRDEARVPTTMMVRVSSAAGDKPALVYNLSVGGAFLETHRPTNVGGTVKLVLPLPSGPLALTARVAAANVPGNLQRPNLPTGMGVCFIGIKPEEREAIAKFVAEREFAYHLVEG